MLFLPVERRRWFALTAIWLTTLTCHPIAAATKRDVLVRLGASSPGRISVAGTSALRLQVSVKSEYASYRLEIRTSQGNMVWSASKLVSRSTGGIQTVTAVVPAKEVSGWKGPVRWVIQVVGVERASDENLGEWELIVDP
jgi:hypothetical protein